MPLVFSCSNCAANIKATNEIVGKSVRCPMCKAVVTVPPSSEYKALGTLGHVEGKAPEMVVEGEIVADADAMTATQSFNQFWRFVGTVGAVVLIGCVAAILLYHGLRRHAPEHAAGPEALQVERPAARPDNPKRAPDVATDIKPATSDDRRFWRFAKQHGSGYFKQLPDGSWDEIGRDGAHMGVWIERGRTPDYVELEDRKRGYLTRLGAGKAWIASNKDGKFNPSPQGDWERQP